jgi:glycosyltransferase involved in cell wall biosynthesis
MWQDLAGGPRTTVLTILPAYNEEESIRHVIQDLSLYFPLTDILVIDDGSSDATSDEVLSTGAELLRLPCNLGVGAALQVALKFAEEKGYDYTLRLDADGQHDPEDAFRLLSAVMSGEADAAIGSRFLAGRWLGKDRNYEAALPRVLGIKLYAGLVSMLTGQRTTDPTSGLRCYNRRVIHYLAHYHPQDYPEVESTVMLHRAGFRLLELPATIRPRFAGESTINSWKSVYYAFRVLLAALIAAVRSPVGI